MSSTDRFRDKFAIVNPKGRPIEELPIIYGFNNGGGGSFWYGQLIAEDGTPLGSHCCSHEGFMYGDLGILTGTRSDRHKTFAKHYPEGYRMEFVPYDDVPTHEKLMSVIKLAEEKESTK